MKIYLGAGNNMNQDKILDKEWLDRVYFAYYSVYNKENSSTDIEEFITWLYKTYGYVKPNA
jgi:hypothetical protein